MRRASSLALITIFFVLVTQSCLTLWNPMDHSLPGSSIHGLLQARIPEWVVIPFSRKSAQPWDWTWVSCIASGFFTVRATRKAVIFFERAPRFSLILPFYTRDSGPCRFSLAQLSSPRFLNHLFADAWGLFDSSKPGDTTMSRTSLPTSLQGFWGPLCTGTISHGLRLTHAAPALSLPGTFLPVLSFKKKIFFFISIEYFPSYAFPLKSGWCTVLHKLQTNNRDFPSHLYSQGGRSTWLSTY